MDIPLIFEDENIVVINKPAGIIVNRSDTTNNIETVQDWAEKKLQIAPHSGISSDSTNSKGQIVEESSKSENRYPIPEQVFYYRGGIVHRLDKETSGILLIAKNPESFTNLQSQFKERMVNKTYIALAHGKIIPTDGEIKAPVDRLPWNRKMFGIVPGGRASVTRYKTLKHFSFSKGKEKGEILTLLELFPETGRTHQIRVHLKYIGHPIFADFLYAGRKSARDDRKHLSRVFLHASKISFSDPSSGKTLTFESPMPDDLKNFVTNNLENIL